MPEREHEVCPLIKMSLMVFRLSGNPLKCREFLRGLGTSSFNVELSISTPLTLQSVLHFVVAYKLICVSHTISQALDFLVELFQNGIEYVVRTLPGLLCYVLSTPSGSHPTVTRFLTRVFDSKPTAPGYTRLWDVTKVLCYLGTIYKSENLSLWDLTLKTVMFVSAQRDL